jgi:hypothetical protein
MKALLVLSKQKAVMVIACASLLGCSSSSPNFVKLDASGKIDPSSTNAETLKRDLADCEVTASQIRTDAGVLLGRSIARTAFTNCMRGKGYVKS